MKSQERQLDPDDTVDLTNCDREPIHLLGNVQGYGCLIATSADFLISHMSENAEEMLGIPVQTAIGSRLIDQLPEKTVHDLRTKLQLVSIDAGAARIFAYDPMQNGKLFDISVHVSGKYYVFEFEPKRVTADRDDMSLVQPLLARVKRAGTVVDAAREAANATQILSGFDRVMVYRFADDGSGEVIAERCASGMEPYLGLRYPASDIPQQARALYKRSMLRLIANVDGDVSPLAPQKSADGMPFDLSLSVTRAVSPIHLEYLRNMGVAASMSVSIMVDGELWGLIACHHRTPHYIDYERRTAIEMFGQFFSYELAQKNERMLRHEQQNARQLHDRLMVRLSMGGDLIAGFSGIAADLADIVPSDGVAVLSDGRIAVQGSVPTEAELRGLARFLNTAPAGQIFATENLAAIYPDAEEFSDIAAGIMSVPISRTPRDYIVFFRREIARSVTWAGNPDKPVTVGPNGVRLTPRKSFAAWKEMVRGCCSSWTGSQKRAAEALRISLIEVVLKLTDEAADARKKAADKQELLIAELNHRVRNILNLIQGLVSQTKRGALDVAAYTEVLDRRIQAMARAHDQLTVREWGPTPLRTLIEVEINAYLNDQRDRVIITGENPLLHPEAYSTFALVIHEMVTNSAKYGALSDRSGTLTIDLGSSLEGGLALTWRESGGPVVKAPTRRGFGSTIIENTIPYELNGKIETRYELAGFEADIWLPASFTEPGEPITDNASMQAEQLPIAPETKLSGHALVLEDNMIIAMDAADILRDAGAVQVHMCGSVDDALEIVNRETISFALLDVNLGDQTSLSVARALSERQIPYVLATGYGDAGSIVKNYPKSRILQKPFTSATLLREVRAALAGS